MTSLVVQYVLTSNYRKPPGASEGVQTVEGTETREGTNAHKTIPKAQTIDRQAEV